MIPIRISIMPIIMLKETILNIISINGMNNSAITSMPKTITIPPIKNLVSVMLYLFEVKDVYKFFEVLYR